MQLISAEDADPTRPEHDNRLPRTCVTTISTGARVLTNARAKVAISENRGRGNLTDVGKNIKRKQKKKANVRQGRNER